MALKQIIPDVDSGPGFALLILDKNPRLEIIEISILNVYRGEYLGPSSAAKVSWVKQPHYFAARRVEAGPDAAFRIGPEVCNYLLPDTVVEISSRDGTIASTQLNWEGITRLEEETAGVILQSPPAAPSIAVDVGGARREPAAPQPKVPQERKSEPPVPREDASVAPVPAVVAAPAPAKPARKGRRAYLWLIAASVVIALLAIPFVLVRAGYYDLAVTVQGPLDFVENATFSSPDQQFTPSKTRIEVRPAFWAGWIQRLWLGDRPPVMLHIDRPWLVTRRVEASPGIIAFEVRPQPGALAGTGGEVNTVILFEHAISGRYFYDRFATLKRTGEPSRNRLKIVAPDLLTFTGPQGGPFSPPSMPVRVEAEGRGFRWSVQGSPPDWLSISPREGELPNSGSAVVALSVLPAAATKAPGVYQAPLIFKNASNEVIARTVQLNVTQPRVGQLTVQPPSVSFTGFTGGPFTPSEIKVRVGASGGGLAWSSEPQAGWISVSPRAGNLTENGAADLSISISPDAGHLAPGDYDGEIAVRKGAALATNVHVHLRVFDPGQECDRRMATRFDPDRPPAAPYVLDTLDTPDEEVDRAIKFCTVARQRDSSPAGRRFVAQLGRAALTRAEHQAIAGNGAAALADMNEALSIWRRAKDLGSSAAMNFLGVYYLGTTFNEEVTAKRRQQNLGPFSFNQGNQDDAFGFFMAAVRASNNRNATALRNAGAIFIDNAFHRRNVGQGVDLLTQAMDLGDMHAAVVLGRAFFTGAFLNLEQNRDKGLQYLGLACRDSDAQASAKRFIEAQIRSNKMLPSQRPPGCF
jgi:hypothetical protein